jgi:hypothetical protein
MDILNHFIDFMTYEMRWRMPLLDVTIELILHTLKLVFHWNVASIFVKQCGHLQHTLLLYSEKLHAVGESLTVTNKMALS